MPNCEVCNRNQGIQGLGCIGGGFDLFHFILLGWVGP
jgi:hypothetical protein